MAGIGVSGALCGYDAFTDVAQWSTSSANCFKKLNPGTYSFDFCIADGSGYANGSIIVLPNE